MVVVLGVEPGRRHSVAAAKLEGGSPSYTRDLKVMSLTGYCSSIPQIGAPRSARTFVSCSSGRRLGCLSYRGEIGTPGRDRTGTLEARGSQPTRVYLFHHRRMVRILGLAPGSG